MMMTQFPLLDRIVADDENGLLTWVDTNHYFYNVMANLHTVNNDKYNAHNLLKEHIDYIGFSDWLTNNTKKLKKCPKFKWVQEIREKI